MTVSGWRAGAGRLVRVAPHAGAHRVALRAGTSVLVPLVVLQLLDRPEWSIYAAFGAFYFLVSAVWLTVAQARKGATERTA